MKKLFGAVLLLLLTSCSALPNFMQPDPLSPGKDCDSFTPTDADIKSALGFGKDVFTEEEWTREYEVYDLNTFVLYTHKSISAVAVVELLMFCDEQGTSNIKETYFDLNMDILFENYQPWIIKEQCNKSDVLLYEMNGYINELAYNMNMWGKVLNSSRALSVRLIVQEMEDSEIFKEYSKTLFPSLYACS